MQSAIEVTAAAIRLVAVRERRIAAIEEWPVPPGADPIAALATAPLPADLGAVRVLLHHEDLLLRALVLPAGEDARLDRLVRFEVSSHADGDEEATVAWCHAPVGPGDARLLVLLAKRRLIARLRQALAPAGARLGALTHPALGLAGAFAAQEPDHQGVACLLDIGGSHLHLALVRDGRPVLLRTVVGGIDELTGRIAAARSLTRGEAARLLARIGAGSPADLHDLIALQAGAIAAQVTAALRFARSQLQLAELAPAAVHIAGAGGQVHGLPAALAAHLGLPVRPLNPFAGHLPALPVDRLDRLAALPSPWCVAIGGAVSEPPALDALADERARRRQGLLTTGALRLGAAAAVLLAVLAVAVVEIRLAAARADLAQLDARAPRATAAAQAARAARAGRDAARARLRWLAGERMVGRIVPELLTAVAGLQDPVACPVALSALRAARRDDATRVELEGAALAAGRAGTDGVLRDFERGLRRLYPAIAAIEVAPVPVERDRHPFRFVLAIPDGGG